MILECETTQYRLYRYLEKQLSTEERQTVHTHLASCYDCKEYLFRLQPLLTTLKKIPQNPAPEPARPTTELKYFDQKIEPQRIPFTEIFSHKALPTLAVLALAAMLTHERHLLNFSLPIPVASEVVAAPSPAIPPEVSDLPVPAEDPAVVAAEPSNPPVHSIAAPTSLFDSLHAQMEPAPAPASTPNTQEHKTPSAEKHLDAATAESTSPPPTKGTAVQDSTESRNDVLGTPEGWMAYLIEDAKTLDLLLAILPGALDETPLHVDFNHQNLLVLVPQTTGSTPSAIDTSEPVVQTHRIEIRYHRLPQQDDDEPPTAAYLPLPKTHLPILLKSVS